MRKSIVRASIVGLAMLSALLFSGCTEDQVVAIARQAGTVAAIGWIQADSPSVEQKAVAAQVVALIKTNTTNIATGTTYYASLTPIINAYIDGNVAAKDRAITRLASSAVLTGVDTLFALYPQYKADSSVALRVMSSFCDGAQIGMAMSSDSAVMKAAMQGTAQRNKDRALSNMSEMIKDSQGTNNVNLR